MEDDFIGRISVVEVIYVFAIQELYNYSSRVRRGFVERLTELPWEELERNREASFYSMKNILIHIINNEDWTAGRKLCDSWQIGRIRATKIC